MSAFIQLSETALKVCKENYAKNCGGCPIRPRCVSSRIAPGIEAHNSWVESINKAADAYRRTS